MSRWNDKGACKAEDYLMTNALHFCFFDWSLWLRGSQQTVENSSRFLEYKIPDHLTFLLRNLYAGKEVIVRTGHGTTDWFQIGKRVCQGCILSPCLFNFYVGCCLWGAQSRTQLKRLSSSSQQQSTSCEMPGWMKHKLKSRLLGEISIISDMQMTPPLRQKVKRN